MSENFENDITDEQYIEQLTDYLEENYLDRILSLMPSSKYVQSIDTPDMYDFFAKRSENFIELLRIAIINIISEHNASLTKEKVQSEFADLKITISTSNTMNLPEVGADMVNSTISFPGVITGLNPKEVYIHRAHMRCPNGHPEGEMNINCNDKRELPKNLECANCGEKLVTVSEKSIFKYIRRATVQEPPELSKKGNPQEIDAVITDSQVDDVSVGDRQDITGILRPLINKKSMETNEHKLIVDVISINDLEGQDEVSFTEDELEEMKNKAQSMDFFTSLANSFAPEVFADDLMLDVKKAMLLCLAGGVKVGSKRGDINILLLGDPSMAKSTLLKFAEKVIKKSLYTSGRGASAAGITIGIVKRHDGTSIAQAGILPLCNHGFAFIDELDKMAPIDRSGLHEAMEQQTVSISKAGFNMSLPAQTAIIAAANPQGGKWNERRPVIDNINLMPTLLSRFDLKFCIRDIVAKGSDEQKADYVLGAYDGDVVAQYSIDDLQKLFNYVRKLKPVMSDGAKKRLKEFFVAIRQKSVEEEQAIIDTRGFEGMIRLSYAHAKIHFKNTVDIHDVEMAISLYESALASFGFDLETGNVSQKTFEQSEKENQIELWWKIWYNVMDEETKCVNEKDFFDELLQYDKIWGVHKAETFWNRLYNDGKILMTRNGWKRID